MNKYDALRERAQEYLNKKNPNANFSNLDELEKFIHELEVFQVELDMQSDELDNTRRTLDETEAKYFELYQLAPVGYINLSLDFKFIDINKTAYALLGIDEQSDLKKMDFRRFILPESQDDFYFFARDIIEKKTTIGAEFLLINHNTNTPIDAHIDGVVNLNKNDQPQGFRFVLTDISKWKKQLSELPLTEERFRFTSNIPYPIIVHINGVIVYCNQIATEFIGEQEADIIGRSIFDFIYRDDIDLVMQNLANRANGEPYLDEYELRLITKSGGLKTVIIKVTNVNFDDKVGEFIIIRDITQRKEYENKLQEYAAFNAVKSAIRSANHTITNESLWSIFIASIKKEFALTATFFSKAKDNILYPELIEGNFNFPIKEYYVRIDENSSSNNSLPALDENGRVKDYVFVHKASGEELNKCEELHQEAMHSLLPIVLESKFYGAIFLCQETARLNFNRISDRILELIDEMRIVLNERHRREEVNRFLIKAKKDAEDLNRAKTEFLANMSHEIRTPLNPIVGFTSYLLSEFNLQPEVAEIIKMIETSSKRLLRILSDVLDMSKIESGNITINEIEFNFNNLVQEIISPHQVKAKSLGYKFVCNIDENINPTYRGDFHRINQIISNLLDNAVRFSYKTQSKIEISIKKLQNYSPLGHQNQKIDWVEFVVSDEGIGIAEDKLDHIFLMFTQADASFTRIYGGSGLGLAIASNLTNLMGGNIKVESKLSEGSNFTVVLPLAPIQLSENTESDEINSNVQSVRYRILLAEDDTANKFLIESLLQADKYMITPANNGEEAVELFKRMEFDLILMDVKMPLLDGESATKLIREIEAEKGRKQTPIIGVTAQTLVGNKDSFLKSGMTDVIFKPFVNNSFIRRINNILEERKE